MIEKNHTHTRSTRSSSPPAVSSGRVSQDTKSAHHHRVFWIFLYIFAIMHLNSRYIFLITTGSDVREWTFLGVPFQGRKYAFDCSTSLKFAMKLRAVETKRTVHVWRQFEHVTHLVSLAPHSCFMNFRPIPIGSFWISEERGVYTPRCTEILWCRKGAECRDVSLRLIRPIYSPINTCYGCVGGEYSRICLPTVLSSFHISTINHVSGN